VQLLTEVFGGLLGPQRSTASSSSVVFPAAPVADAPMAAAPHVTLSDAQLSQIVDRVIERLTERLGGGDASDLVSRIAERIVREEIAEIKKRL
jgi:hypothetical protein